MSLYDPVSKNVVVLLFDKMFFLFCTLNILHVFVSPVTYDNGMILFENLDKVLE